MLSSSDARLPSSEPAAARDAQGVAPPHSELLAVALRQWFGVAVSRYQRGQRADLAFRDAIDLACARARTDGIPIERLIVALRSSVAGETSTLPADRRTALIDTVISECIQRFYDSREERSRDPGDRDRSE